MTELLAKLTAYCKQSSHLLGLVEDNDVKHVYVQARSSATKQIKHVSPTKGDRSELQVCSLNK